MKTRIQHVTSRSLRTLALSPQQVGFRDARRRPRSVGGFTLIELLLVLVILAILAGIVITKFAGRTEQARNTAAKTTISNVATALEAYEVDTGHYPTTQEGLQALTQAPSGATNWKGPYLQKAVGNDPWDHPFVYRCPGQHNTDGFDLYSFGPDGQDGTPDDIANWENK